MTGSDWSLIRMAPGKSAVLIIVDAYYSYYTTIIKFTYIHAYIYIYIYRSGSTLVLPMFFFEWQKADNNPPLPPPKYKNS